MNISDSNIEPIKKKLLIVSKRENFKHLLNSILLLIAIIFTTNLILSFLELVGLNSSGERELLFFAGIIIVTVFFIKVASRFLRYINVIGKIDFIEIAKFVGNSISGIKDELVNTLQLDLEKNKKLYSPDLIDASLASCYKKLGTIDFKQIVSFNSTKKFSILTLIFIVLNILLFISFPQLSWATFRIIKYDKEFSVSPKMMFEVSPGDSTITKGDPLKIKFVIYGESTDEIEINIKSKDETKYERKKLFRNSEGGFYIKLENVQQSFTYFAKSNGVVSNKYFIKVIERPKIRTIRLKIIPPQYSGLTITEQIDNGNITSLYGSEVRLELISSKELKSAKLVFNDSSSLNMNVESKRAKLFFHITRDQKYKIIVADNFDILNSNPVEYSISAIPDEYPGINLFEPVKDVQLDARNVVPINFQIKDDYGFQQLVLKYRLSASKFEDAWDKYREVKISIPPKVKEYEYNYLWNLADINPAVGDVYSFYLEVFDNDNVSGPKTAKTKIINVKIPGIDEIFNDAESKQNEALTDLNKTLKDAEQLKKELEKISNEIRQDKKDLSWDEKEKIQQSIQKFEELQQKVTESKEQLSQMQDKLEANKLLSERTLQKYNELQNLLNELNSDEVKEALKRLEEAMKTMNRENSQKSFENFKLNEEMFQKSLDRTINLLKRIQIEQKMDEVIKRTEAITEQLENLQKQIDDNSLKEEIINRQNELTKELQALENELKKLADKMKEFEDLPNKEMQKLQSEIENQDNDEYSSDIEKELKEGNTEKAGKMQKQLLNNMKKNKQRLEQLQSSMQMQNQMNTMMQMLKALNGILDISKEQEELKANINSSEIRINSTTQNQLRSNLDRIINQLSELSQKTFAITPEMGKALGSAKANMNQAIQNLQSNNVSNAKSSQQQAMKSLNEAASLLKGGMEQMMQNNGQGAGMMSLMQQMEKLSQQQMGLNQMVQKMQNGELSEGEMGQMQRLAEQQEMIRKSLQELNEEARESGQSKKLSASLEEIIKEMKEVVSNLQSEKLNDDVVKSQDKILSRMLDAQRSMNERDYEQKRESNSGKIFNRTSPADLKNYDSKTKLQEELQKALREGYKKDYEELIRKYYESLEKK